MNNVVFLKLSPTTFQAFQNLHLRLNLDDQEHLAPELGKVLADLSNEVIDQVFAEIARIRQNAALETEHTIQHIQANIHKYMPWSVSFFSNDRLMPLVNYLAQHIQTVHQQSYLTFCIQPELLKQALAHLARVQQGETDYIVPTFQLFTQIVDEGVTQLIYEPKNLLKFNFMVDKTLNSVIRLTTQLGYKRIEKVSSQFDLNSAQQTLQHFFTFIQQPK